MIDELMPEGVPINVEKDMSKNIGVSLKKGNHRLNGKELLGYASIVTTLKVTSDACDVSNK